ncbi:GNAT family N-acetyltransferase [Rhodoferax sp.]|uniref:GNAT family N-acetyltransferase n=1 Tax=Rhodoferax sp. TaxID=50421 RepID=UPI00374D6738
MTPTPSTALQVRRVDYRDPTDAAALLQLLELYAQDPMGGSTPLNEDTKQRLCADLAQLPHASSFIAWQGDEPVGLANCFEAYSTFKARPLLNIHDLAVHPAHRGRGVGQTLLAAIAEHAQKRGCCKLTLEVLSGNAAALASYQRFGFAGYQLGATAGQAVFLQKWL